MVYRIGERIVDKEKNKKMIVKFALMDILRATIIKSFYNLNCK